MSEFQGGSEFDAIAADFDERDRHAAALGVAEDIDAGLKRGEVHADDPQVREGEKAIEKLMGECVFDSGGSRTIAYCKFYGSNPDFCDRSCGDSFLDV